MNNHLLLLTPLVVLLILAVFSFTGCAKFKAADEPAGETPAAKKPDPDPNKTPPPIDPVPSVVPTYGEVVATTAGFLAHWPLNEPSGTRANVLGPLSLVSYGDYQQLSGVDLGADGVLHAKDPTNLAPHFKGTSAYVDVGYQAVLNPMNVDFSVELWVKPDAASGTDEQTVISSHRFDSMNKQQGYEVDLVRVPTESHQQVRARVYSGGNATDVVVQPIQGDPQGWRYVLLTFQAGAAGSGTVKLYARVLGDLNLLQAGQSSASYQNVGSANPSTLRFGASHRMNQAAGNFFAGRIDEVAFYNSVLVSTDIDKRFNKV